MEEFRVFEHLCRQSTFKSATTVSPGVSVSCQYGVMFSCLLQTVLRIVGKAQVTHRPENAGAADIRLRGCGAFCGGDLLLTTVIFLLFLSK